MSLIIGIDPGSRMTGYGIISSSNGTLSYVDAGTIYTDSPDMPVRIGQIFDGITRIISHHQKYQDTPIIAAVEQVFMANNPDSALKLGQARGAAIAGLTACNISVSEYTARQIKQAVCGYGAADKQQVTAMVVRLLNLAFIPQSDAADGLACAICHAYTNHATTKIMGKTLVRTTVKKKGRFRLTEDDLLYLNYHKNKPKK